MTEMTNGGKAQADPPRRQWERHEESEPVSKLTHDLNNALGAIVNLAHLGKLEPGTVDETLDEILNVAARARHLVEQIEATTSPSIETAGGPSGPEASSAAHGAGRRVMLVDDDPQVLPAVSKILERGGYAVEAFDSASDAWQRFAARPEAFSVVVTDLVMPERSGADLVEAIKQRRPSTRVIVCTGSVAPDLDRRARALGVTEVLRKPIHPEELSGAIDRAIAKEEA